MLNFQDDVLMLPAEVQKEYPNDNSPVYTEIALAPETQRVLRTIWTAGGRIWQPCSNRGHPTR